MGVDVFEPTVPPERADRQQANQVDLRSVRLKPSRNCETRIEPTRPAAQQNNRSDMSFSLPIPQRAEHRNDAGSERSLLPLPLDILKSETCQLGLRPYLTIPISAATGT